MIASARRGRARGWPSYTDGILEVRIRIDTATAEAGKIPVSHG